MSHRSYLCGIAFKSEHETGVSRDADASFRRRPGCRQNSYSSRTTAYISKPFVHDEPTNIPLRPHRIQWTPASNSEDHSHTSIGTVALAASSGSALVRLQPPYGRGKESVPHMASTVTVSDRRSHQTYPVLMHLHLNGVLAISHDL